MKLPTSLLVTAILLCAMAHGAPITRRIITAPNATPLPYPFTQGFGQVMAASAKYFVFGTPMAESGAGSVFVYSAPTGKHLRTLRSPAAETDGNTAFGSQVAISGDFILVGAPGANVNSVTDTGRIYVFNALTGAITSRLDLSGDSNANNLRLGGDSLSAEGDLCVTGSTTYDGKGRAWLFNFKTGAMQMVLTSASLSNGEMFGAPAVISGNLIAVSARMYKNGGDAAPGGGRVFVFNRLSGIVTSVAPFTANGGGNFGYSLALEGFRALIGSPFVNGGRGKAELVDLRTGKVTDTYVCPDTQSANDYFGEAVALQGGLAVISAAHYGNPDGGAVYYCDATSNKPLNNATRLEIPLVDPADVLGAVMALSGTNLLVAHYANGAKEKQQVSWLQNVPEPFNGDVIARTRDSTPSTFDRPMYGSTYKGFTAVAVDPAGTAMFNATVNRGSGTDPHVSRGVWAVDSNGNLKLMANDAYFSSTDKRYGVTNVAQFNQTGLGMFHNTYFGPGITTDRLEVRTHFGLSGNTPFRSDDELFGANTVVNSFPQLAQSFDNADSYTAARYLLMIGKGGVTPANDSSISFHSNMNGNTTVAREGTSGVGQIAAMSMNWSKVAYVCAQTARPGGSGIYTWDRGTQTTSLLVQTGDSPGGSFGNYSSFNGVTTAGDGDKVGFRARLGTGLSAVDAVVSNRPGALQVEFASNQTPTFTSGTITAIKTSKILGYWLENESILMLVTLKGVGITAANDTCLICAPAGGSGPTYMLLREGDVAPGGRGGRIGTIQRVDAEPQGGTYLALCSLVGAPPGEDQILYAGNFDHPDGSGASSLAPDPLLRGPCVLMRKGALINTGLGGTAKVTSIKVTARGTDGSGAGGNTPRNIGSYAASVIVGFSDGTSAVVSSLLPFSF